MVLWINPMIVAIDNKHAVITNMIPLMSIALMCIQVNNHHPLNLESVPNVVHSQGDIWIDTKATSIITAGMMISAR
jgi:hypothetical protein